MKPINKQIRKEILSYNYWEHFKAEKELSTVLPVEHSRRVKIMEEGHKILAEIHKL